ncbi:MAG: PAS domain S-box protein [Gemmatimonadota bacterium]|nr:PAS domain S-box protein [Gemmatimonadota bacterium]
MSERPPGGEGPPSPPPAGSSSAPTPVEAASPNGHARDPVFILRETGEILFANTSLGDRTEDEVIGTSILDWMPSDQHQGITDVLRAAFETGETQRLELAGLQRGNEEAWFDCRITPNVREQKVVSATLVAHDITQYRRTLQQLQTSKRELEQLLEERTADLTRATAAADQESRTREEEESGWTQFRTLMDQAGEAIFVTDPRTERVIDVNETAARWIGRMREDLVGLQLRELHLAFPIQPPPEDELQWTDTRDTRRPLILRGTHRRRDGSTFPVEVAVARHVLGKQHFVLAVARDMKGRLDAEERLGESERQYRNLFEQCWDAIYLTARNGEIEDVNNAGVELFGYTKDEFLGLDARQLFARPMDIKRFQVQMKTLGSVGDLEVELHTKNGIPFEALLSATRRPSENGAIRGYQIIVRPMSLPTTGRSSPNDEATPEDAEPRTTPSADLRISGTVVIANSEGSALAQAADALFAAGMRVMTAESHDAALDLLRVHGASIDATVLDADAAGSDLRRVLEAIRQHAPNTGILLVSGGETVDVAESVADLGIRTILRKPLHPLALIQKIREL